MIIIINFHFFCQNVLKSGQWYLVQWYCSTCGGVLVVYKSASVPRVSFHSRFLRSVSGERNF